jgi:YesN/AraC family two-component response regulator
MPQIGGLAAIKVIRQEHPNTSILAISGYYDKLSDLVKDEDIDGILPKPIGMETLQSTLDRIFSNRMRLNCRG